MQLPEFIDTVQFSGIDAVKVKTIFLTSENPSGLPAPKCLCTIEIYVSE